MKKHRFQFVASIFLLSFFGYCANALLGAFYAPIAIDIGVSKVLVGAIFATFPLVSLLSSLILGSRVHAIGKRLLFFTGLSLIIIACFGFASLQPFIPSSTQLTAPPASSSSYFSSSSSSSSYFSSSSSFSSPSSSLFPSLTSLSSKNGTNSDQNQTCISKYSPSYSHSYSYSYSTFSSSSSSLLITTKSNAGEERAKKKSGNAHIPFIVISFAMRAFQGIGSAVLAIVAQSAVTQAYPENMGFVQGLWETVIGFAYAVAPILGGALFEAGGWYLPFVTIGSCITLCTIPLIWFYFCLPSPNSSLPDSKSIQGSSSSKKKQGKNPDQEELRTLLRVVSVDSEWDTSSEQYVSTPSFDSLLITEVSSSSSSSSSSYSSSSSDDEDFKKDEDETENHDENSKEKLLNPQEEEEEEEKEEENKKEKKQKKNEKDEIDLDSLPDAPFFSVLLRPRILAVIFGISSYMAVFGFQDPVLAPTLLNPCGPYRLTSAIQVGVVFVACSGVYTVGSIIIGVLSDKWTFLQIPLFVIGLFIGAIAMVIMGPANIFLSIFPSSNTLMIVAQVILGFGGALSLVLSFPVAVSPFEAEKNSQVNYLNTLSGIFSAGWSLGEVIGPLISNPIVLALDFGNGCAVMGLALLVSAVTALLAFIFSSPLVICCLCCSCCSKKKKKNIND
jgi:MFS family permease